jgi:hypothetical protein
MASLPPSVGSADGPKGQETFPPEVITVAVGMPGREITLIAAGSALVAAVLAVLAYRFWAARRLAASQQLAAIPAAAEAADVIAN